MRKEKELNRKKKIFQLVKHEKYDDMINLIRIKSDIKKAASI